jgi:agmatine/peptidylarginine deiminase
MRRLPAEWERQSCLLIVFPHIDSDWECCFDEICDTYVKIISIVSRYQQCLIVCDDIDKIKKRVPLNKNTLFAKISTNDTWIRDFGGIDIFEEDKVKTLDFTFNGWGLKYPANYDNFVTRQMYKQKLFQNPLQTIGFVLEGGSIDTNGKGVLLTTRKCLLEKNRNPHFSLEQIEAKLKEFFAVSKVLWLENGALSGDDTDSHIDTLARFIDEKTIAYVKCEDKSDEHYKELKKMEDELKSFGYDLLPLPLPEAKYFQGRRLPATYANFLFINDAVLIPTYNDKNDKKVLETFEKFFPKRDIIGIDCSVLIRQHGSLHCATMHKFIAPNKSNI